MTKKKRRLKRIYGVSTIILALLLIFIPTFTRAADPTDAGEDGDIVWSIDGDTLTLSAKQDTEGVIKTYDDRHAKFAPWSESNCINTVRKVVVENGVTSLGRFAFSFCTRDNLVLDKVTIPGTVTDIGEYAAEGLRAKEIEFENGVKTIEASAFYDCIVNVIRFPESIESIGRFESGDTDQFRVNGNKEDYRITDIYGYCGTAAEEFTNLINERVLTGWIQPQDDREILDLYRNTGTHEYVRGNTVIEFHPLDNSASLPDENTVTVVDRRGADGIKLATGTAKTFPLYDDTKGISVVPETISEKLYFYVRNVDSTDKTSRDKLKELVTIPTGGSLAWYDLTLLNRKEEVPEDFGSCLITLPIPSDMDTSKGTIKVVTVKADSSLGELDTKTTVVNGIDCVEFTATRFLDSGTEFGLLYTLNESGGGGEEGGGEEEKPTYATYISDERSDKTNSGCFTASVTNLTDNYYLHIKDTSATALKSKITLSSGDSAVYYDLSLTDKDGNVITNFGECILTIPIPSDMDTSKGSLKVATLDSSGNLENKNVTIVEINGVKCARFTVTHFSDYGLIYTKTGSDDDTTSYTLTIDDQRTTKTGTVDATLADMSKLTKNAILHVKDSDGKDLEGILHTLSSNEDAFYYDLSFTDENNVAITDFGTITITAPMPQYDDGWDITKGDIKVYTATLDGKEEVLTSSLKAVDDLTCAEFKTTHFSDFAIVYTSESEPTSDYSIIITDYRKDKPNTECLSATVSKTLTENLYLYIRDESSEGATTSREIKKLISLGSNAKLSWYDITLKTADGKDASGFGSCTIVMPLPSDYDTNKGTVKAYTISTSNTLEALTTTIKTVKNVKCASFTSTHFSEYALVYTPDSSSQSKSSAAGGKTSPGKKKNNYRDMPRTGGADVLRVLFALLLFAFGVRELITSVYVKKEKDAIIKKN